MISVVQLLLATGGTIYIDELQSNVEPNFDVSTRIPWIYGNECVGSTDGGGVNLPTREDCAKRCYARSSGNLTNLCCAYRITKTQAGLPIPYCSWGYNGTVMRTKEPNYAVLMTKLGAAGVSLLGTSGKLDNNTLRIEPRSQGVGYCTNPKNNTMTRYAPDKDVKTADLCMNWCYQTMKNMSLLQVNYTENRFKPSTSSTGSVCCQYTPEPNSYWEGDINTTTSFSNQTRCNNMWSATGWSGANVCNKCFVMWSADGATRYINSKPGLSCTEDFDYRTSTDVSICMAAKVNTTNASCTPYDEFKTSCVSNWSNTYVGLPNFTLTYVSALDRLDREYTSWAVNNTWELTTTGTITTTTQTTSTNTTTTTQTTLTAKSNKSHVSTTTGSSSDVWSSDDGGLFIALTLLFGSICLLCMVLLQHRFEKHGLQPTKDYVVKKNLWVNKPQ
jgi:hypothetical protein